MPNITLQQSMVILLNTAHLRLKHQDYEHVTELSKRFTAYATGVGIDDMLLQYNPRESEDLFAQRKKFTKSITLDLVGSCKKPMAKVGRAPATKMLQWKDKAETDKNRVEVEDGASAFYGEQSVDKYLTERMPEMDTIDPNSFIVVEFTNEVGKNEIDPKDQKTKAMPYPFEVSSEEAWNYIYKNNTLQWLVARRCANMYDGKIYVEGDEFLMYFPINSIRAIQIHKDVIEDWKLKNTFTVITKEIDENTSLVPKTVYLFETPGKEDKKFYAITVYEHKMPFIPARRVGVIRDETTRGRTVLPLIHQAEPYFEKSIKGMSEFDLTTCLHTFPQKIQYSDPCGGYHDDKNLVACNRGFAPNGSECKACHGSGYKYHQSSQDMLQIRMPKDPKDMVSLENVIAYKNPPIDFLNFMKEYNFYELRYFAQKAVYNSENFSKDSVNNTATEVLLDLDAVYDTLTPWADNWSGMWSFIYRCIASLRNVYDGATIKHTFPKDFKMKSLTTLLDDLKKATENGAPSHIKKAIISDISHKIYIDCPEEILKIDTKEKYFPFTGKTDAEIGALMTESLISEKNKVLYANFERIFVDLEFDASEEGLNFYDIVEETQRTLIDAKVQGYIDGLNATTSTDVQTAFNAAAGNAMLNFTTPEPGAQPANG